MPTKTRNVADVESIKRWSPVWIIPLVTLLIGTWLVGNHIVNKGQVVTLMAATAEGLDAGKTKIKSRSVTIGLVEKITLSDDLKHVVLKARINKGMEKMLKDDAIFWTVKPQVGRDGVTGLSTLLSGAYIELQQGSNNAKPQTNFTLYDTPPLASPDAKGIRVVLESKEAGQLKIGDPVLFHGFPVGSVETSDFDPNELVMRHQLFISAPYDALVTTNVRFWKESGIAFDMSAKGMRVELGSVSTLLSGGVSFDVPEGRDKGDAASGSAHYQLFASKNDIEDSLYTQHKDYLLFFDESVRGLNKGASVEFRGIHLGRVAEVPFYIDGMQQRLSDDYRIPVLIRIEPERLPELMTSGFDFEKGFRDGIKRGLRASLKSGSLLTSSLFIDLDFYPNAMAWDGVEQHLGYNVMPTVNGGLAQLQQKLMVALDKINNMPLTPMVEEATGTLKEMQKTLKSLNSITASDSMKALPSELQKTLNSLNSTLHNFQPGGAGYNTMMGDMQRLENVMQELQPLLRTLNGKSNALIFQGRGQADPQPRGAK